MRAKLILEYIKDFGVLFTILTIFIQSTETKKLPPFLKNLRCKLKDPSLEACFITNGNRAIPLVAQGIPELDIPNVMPLKIPFLQLINTRELQLNMSNIRMYGLDKLKLIDVKLNVGEISQLQEVLMGEKVIIEGNYSVDGKILMMPIKGQDSFSIELKNGIYNITIFFRLIEKNDVMYAERVNIFQTTDFEKVILNFENLFGGQNTTFSDEVNKFLNNNWNLLLNDYKPSLSNILREYVGKLVDKFSDIPLNDVYIM